MASPKKRVEDLGVVIEDHPGPNYGMTSTGLKKMGEHTFVVPSNAEREDEDEDGVPAAEPEPIAEPAPAPKAKKKTRKKSAEPVQDEEPQGMVIAAPKAPEFVNVKLTLEPFGELPTQYADVRIGEGCAVLTCNDLSFKPKKFDINKETGEYINAVELDLMPGVVYGFMGHTFRDKTGHTCLILMEFPKLEQ